MAWVAGCLYGMSSKCRFCKPLTIPVTFNSDTLDFRILGSQLSSTAKEGDVDLLPDATLRMRKKEQACIIKWLWY